MKRLTVAVLVFSAFIPAVFAQTVEEKQPRVVPEYCVEIINGTETHCEYVPTPAAHAQTAEQADRHSVWSVWQQKVAGAEKDYMSKNGRYGDLAALKKAHLLRNLVFEPCSSVDASAKQTANFVPKSTLVQVTVSEDGQHFNVTVLDDTRRCSAPLKYHGPLYRDFEDSPEGPLLPG